ncbi:MAG: hypothetical protein GY820_31375 [Gammaproteobacteria bacterium]|nr:hypothetical protein [Gammaproteobacteria bacterium]
MIIFSDEAVFTVDGRVNKQNCRYWCDENPNFYTEQPLHSPKVMVWCALWSGGLIGPFFFEGSVTAPTYLEMLEKFFWPLIADHPNRQELFFMQDGAPPHFAITVRQWLDENFEEKWIGRRGPIEWPPRSPDLTPCDFFLWGYLKSLVYKEKPQGVEDLKIKISAACASIEQEVIDRSLVKYKNRLGKCIEIGGGHIEQLL